MGEEDHKEWRVAPIHLEDIRGLFNFLSEDNFKREHSYILKHYPGRLLISVTPVTDNSECGLCGKPIESYDGFKFNRLIFDLCNDPNKKGKFEERGMVFFSHYRHLHMKNLE